MQKHRGEVYTLGCQIAFARSLLYYTIADSTRHNYNVVYDTNIPRITVAGGRHGMPYCYSC